MLTKTMTYPDYYGNERTESFYFNMSKGELTEMKFSVNGDLGVILERIIETQDQPALFKFFKDIVLKSYGEISADGKRFIKSEEMSIAFSQTEAYSQLITELISNEEVAAKFINGIMPKDLVEQAKPMLEQVSPAFVN